jgi:hypothetical protein
MLVLICCNVHTYAIMRIHFISMLLNYVNAHMPKHSTANASQHLKHCIGGTCYFGIEIWLLITWRRTKTRMRKCSLVVRVRVYV